MTAQEAAQYPVCKRCKRHAVDWPVYRGDRCSPRDWWLCIRDPFTVAAENGQEFRGVCMPVRVNA